MTAEDTRNKPRKDEIDNRIVSCQYYTIKQVTQPILSEKHFHEGQRKSSIIDCRIDKIKHVILAITLYTIHVPDFGSRNHAFHQ